MESRYGIGVLFQSVIGAYITAMVRIKIFEWAERNSLEICEIATDAVIARLKPGANLTTTKELGGFELKKDFPASVVIFSSGTTLTTDGRLIRFRGVPTNSRENVRMKTPPPAFKGGTMIIKTNSPVKMKQALIQEGLSVNDVGKFREVKKRFKMNSNDRVWLDDKIDADKLFSNKISSVEVPFSHLDDRGETDEEELEEIGSLFLHGQMISKKVLEIKATLKKHEDESAASRLKWHKFRETLKASPEPSHTPAFSLPARPPS